MAPGVSHPDLGGTGGYDWGPKVSQPAPDRRGAPRALAWAEAGIGSTDRALEQYSRIDGIGWDHIGVLDGLFSLRGLYKGGLQSAIDGSFPIRDDPRYQGLLREAYRA